MEAMAPAGYLRPSMAANDMEEGGLSVYGPQVRSAYRLVMGHMSGRGLAERTMPSVLLIMSKKCVL